MAQHGESCKTISCPVQASGLVDGRNATGDFGAIAAGSHQLRMCSAFLLTKSGCGRIRELGDVMAKLTTMPSIAAAALMLSSAAAMACAFDTDCSPGSKCVKPKGFVTGMCTGGLFPGNRHDQKPFHDPFDPN